MWRMRCKAREIVIADTSFSLIHSAETFVNMSYVSINQYIEKLGKDKKMKD